MLVDLDSDIIGSLIILGDSRRMIELSNESIDLVVTSPPYWHIKDYNAAGQIGHGQSLHEYLIDLYRVWKECFRVLKPGRRLCVNIGDQFASSVIYGRYKIIPLHAEIIAQCEDIGFDYMGAIIWQKKTTMNTSGGANVMGSYPYPPNGMVELDYEYILIFKKPGPVERKNKELKEASKLSKEEWKEYFSGHWHFAGARQVGHEAMFPEELPKRLIKMFTFVGEVVLDPFVGSGTTALAAITLNRRAIGYEIQRRFLSLIKERFGLYFNDDYIKVIERNESIDMDDKISYVPRIKNAVPDFAKLNLKKGSKETYKVIDIVDESTIMLENGRLIKFLGIIVKDKLKTIEYLREKVLRREVYIKTGLESTNGVNLYEFDTVNRFISNKSVVQDVSSAGVVEAYVYLKNKIFVNSYLIKSGLAVADRNKTHKYKEKFIKLENVGI